MAFDREDTNTIVTLHGSRGHHSLEDLQKLLVDEPKVKKQERNIYFSDMQNIYFYKIAMRREELAKRKVAVCKN